MDVTKNIEHLLSLFDHREKLKAASNRKIIAVLNDSLIRALRELISLSDDAISWDGVELLDGQALALQFTVEYDPSAPMSTFLSMMDASSPQSSVVKVHRTVVFGIPLHTLFLPVADIKEWFIKAAAKSFGQPTVDAGNVEKQASVDPTPPRTEQTFGFDPSLLTQEQMSQLLYFQQLTKGVKQ